ncbi:MAG: hypothetical protein ACYTFK_13900 [Planctomycetota bacterium]|jgi:hypothetical protein
MDAVIKTYHIHSPSIEATQRGYAVTVARKGHKRGDLTYHHGADAYENACSVVTSVKRGRLVFSRDGWSFNLNGKTLTCSKFVNFG